MRKLESKKSETKKSETKKKENEELNVHSNVKDTLEIKVQRIFYIAMDLRRYV